MREDNKYDTKSDSYWEPLLGNDLRNIYVRISVHEALLFDFCYFGF